MGSHLCQVVFCVMGTVVVEHQYWQLKEAGFFDEVVKEAAELWAISCRRGQEDGLF